MKTHHFSTALLTDIQQGKAIRFPCPAKLNLFLYINGKRADGYHELQTLFQFVDYGDWLTISPRHDGQICLSPDIPDLKSEDNLIYRAAKLLQQHTGCKLGADLHLDKILPIGGGIGGGSSDAATTLLALNYLWQTQLTLHELTELGLNLGADLPIFIHGKAAFAEGIGEKITYCEPAEKWYVVLKPEATHIATAEIFAAPNLNRNTPKKTINQLIASEYANDCEKIVLNLYPKVEELLHWLLEYAPARLTGTGACVFAEFEDELSAQAVFDIKPKHFSGFVAKGSNISPLHKVLSLLCKQK